MTSAVMAESIFPGPDWKDRPNPLASPDAEPGGGISALAGQYPQSLNYYLDNNSFVADLFGSMYETLLTMNPLTAEYEPGLASKWAISDDKQSFTFWINPNARWSDGKPVTADDVIWTFNAIMNPTNMTGVHKVMLQVFEKPEKIDDLTVRFRANIVHWRNLGAVGGFEILPKHAFHEQDFNKVNFEFPVVSGPYSIDEISEGRFIRIKRRSDWWAGSQERFQNMFNFDTITYRFFADRTTAFEAFRKGQFDIFPVYTARLWVNETDGTRFTRNWIAKQRVVNHKPVGFQGFAINMRRAPFDDVKIRQALAYLLDREKMNRTIMYNQYFLHRSYYEDLYTHTNPCPNTFYEFNKDKARELLKEAGWKANPETGLLEKDGKPFVIRFLTRDPTSDKFLAIYGEDLKDVGIQLEIVKKDWAAWSKDMDTFDYDMTWAAWGASLFRDPEGMWASAEADRQGGNNITGFKDPKVDELIEEQKAIFDLGKRNEICRTIDQKVAEECPYILLWNIRAVRLLYWNKFGTPDTVLSKYGDEGAAFAYWWYDPDAAEALEDAMEQDLPVTPREYEVQFDQVFEEPE
jgi:microcin C transport system substrate-binding protein